MRSAAEGVVDIFLLLSRTPWTDGAHGSPPRLCGLACWRVAAGHPLETDKCPAIWLSPEIGMCWLRPALRATVAEISSRMYVPSPAPADRRAPRRSGQTPSWCRDPSSRRWRCRTGSRRRRIRSAPPRRSASTAAFVNVKVPEGLSCSVDDGVHRRQIASDDGVPALDQELREHLLRLRIVELANADRRR